MLICHLHYPCYVLSLLTLHIRLPLGLLQEVVNIFVNYVKEKDGKDKDTPLDGPVDCDFVSHDVSRDCPSLTQQKK